MITLGRLSYSAYLWHWPIAVFMYMKGYATNGYALLPLFALTFLLSHITYRFIENPARKSALGVKAALVYFVIVPVLILMTMFYVTRKYDGIPQRLGAEQARAYSVINDAVDKIRDRCHSYIGTDIEACAFGEIIKPKGTLLYLGDSHAAHLRSFVDELVNDAQLKGYVQTDSACLMLAGDYAATNKNQAPSCLQRTIRMHNLREHRCFEYVVISQLWLGYTTNTLTINGKPAGLAPYEEALIQTIDMIERSGAKAVLLLPVAEGDGSNLNRCFYQNISNPNLCDIEKSDSDKRLTGIYSMMTHINTLRPATIMVDPQAVQCAEGKCMAAYEGIPIYEDTHHVYDFSARLFAQQYLERFGNPLREAP